MSDPINSIPEKRPSLFRNWISLVGLVVGIGALFSFLLLFALDASSNQIGTKRTRQNNADGR